MRIFLPFPNVRKVVWNLAEQLERIEWAISETDQQHFEQELRALYVLLGKHGMKVPLLDPVVIGDRTYDTTWYGFHLTYLKVLRRWIRNAEFDLKEWNSSVTRENAKRQGYAEEHARRDSGESRGG